jgi:alpha-1,2-mannosyltransferase
VGAVLFGLSIALKITPALFLLLFLWKRQWRMAIYTAVASIVWLVLPAVYMGPTNWWAHQTEWTQNAVSSLLDQQVEGRLVNEQRIRNQAIRPTLLRYLVTYPGSHPMRRDDPGYRPVLDLSPRVATGIVAALMLGILWCFAWASRESFQGPKDSAWPRDSAGLLLLTLLFSPMTWQQHLVWVVPAAFVVVASARSGGGMSKTEWMMMGAYIVLTMILNYEVLGREKFHVLMSYHPFGIAVLVLFGLVVLCSYRGRRTRAGSRLV